MGRVYLEKRWPDCNQYRYYAIQVQPTLFGGWMMQREWGRIGHPGTVRETWFATEDEAEEAVLRLHERKEKRGYRPACRSGGPSTSPVEAAGGESGPQ